MQGTVGGIGLLKGISPITINMIDMVSKQGTISFEYIFFFWSGQLSRSRLKGTWSKLMKNSEL